MKGQKRVAHSGRKGFCQNDSTVFEGSDLAGGERIFKRVGITFTRKAAEKAIPFGVGVIIGFSANKGLTWYVGNRAKAFFSI